MGSIVLRMVRQSVDVPKPLRRAVMSTMGEDEVVRAITTTNYLQAHIWEQALRDAGIRCKVVGDELMASVGGISGTPAEIWVHKDDLDQAREILEELESPLGEETEEDEEPARWAGLLDEVVQVLQGTG